MDLAPDPATPSARRSSVLAGVGLGLAYGIAARLTVEVASHVPVLRSIFSAMTLSVLVLVPVAMGWLAVRPHPHPSWWRRLFLPWLPVLACIGTALLVGWEGAICLLMGGPLMLVMGSLGGVLAGMASARERRLSRIILVLPLLGAPVESLWQPAGQVREVRVECHIAAPPAVVWRNVVQVPQIGPEEHRPALFTALGFPRPLSATLAREEIGGVRHARFEGGVLFVETVTALEPERHLAFTLRARSDLIPPSTLDPHVTIGGPFFDTLDGSYRLAAGPGGGTQVVLTSRHRLSTRFDVYAGLWSDAIMRSIQRNILAIVRARSEAATPVARSTSARSLHPAGITAVVP